MSTPAPRPLESVVDGPRATTLLEHPLRLAILGEAREPRSATEIAGRLGETRQKVNYHLGKLRDGGFVEPAGTRPRRGLQEHLYVATARRYALSPTVLGDLAPSPRDLTDRLSADYLLALAARTQSEVGRAATEAAATGQRLATLSIDADVWFADADTRTAFTEELHDAVLRLVARHSTPGADDARPYRLVVGAHPDPTLPFRRGDPMTPSDLHPDGRRVEVSTRIAASPRRLWRAWTDPDDLSRWFTDRARGEVVEGGTITWVFDQMNVEIPYPVAVADVDRRMVLAGEAPGRGPFALEVTLEADGDETIVRLVNSGFLDGAEWDDEYRGVASGWTLALALLKHYAEQHSDRPKRVIQHFRPADFEWSALPYRTAAELAGWLTLSGSIGDPDDAVALVLHDGTPLTGRVLARSGTEVAVSWQEEDAVLELKAFAAGPRRMRGVRLTAWGMADGRAETLSATLEQAVARLA